MMVFLLPEPLPMVQRQEEWITNLRRASPVRWLQTEPGQNQSNSIKETPETPGTMRLRERALMRLLSPLDGTAYFPEGDEVGPTSRALKLAERLLSAFCAELPLPLPEGVAYSDGEGGLRVDFAHGNRQVRLVLSGKGSEYDYLYHQDENEHGVTPLTNREQFIGWLRRMQGTTK